MKTLREVKIGETATVAVPPATKPSSSRCLLTSGEPPTLRIRFSVPTSASANGIIPIPPIFSVSFI